MPKAWPVPLGTLPQTPWHCWSVPLCLLESRRSELPAFCFEFLWNSGDSINESGCTLKCGAFCLKKQCLSKPRASFTVVWWPQKPTECPLLSHVGTYVNLQKKKKKKSLGQWDFYRFFHACSCLSSSISMRPSINWTNMVPWRMVR